MAIDQESILGSFLPNIYITKITLNDDKVILNLMRKEKPSDKDTEIFSNDYLNKFTKIKVLQITDRNTFYNLAEDFVRDLDIENSFVSMQGILISISDDSIITFDTDNNKEIHYTSVFELNTENLDFLGYYVFCDLDKQAIIQEFNLLPRFFTQELPSKINNEIIIENSFISSKSYIYLLPDQTLWAGDITMTGDNYTTVEQSPRLLQRVIINNNKIQDFRNRNIRNLPQINFVERSLQENNKQNKEEFIYNIKHIVNSDKTVTICFLIDFEKLLKRFSPFPQLINENSTEPNLNDSILSKTLIKSIKLFRRQVKTSINFLKTKQIDPYKSDEIVSDILVQNLPCDLENANVKLYSITDTSIAKKNEGEYQYYAEFVFEDGTINFLKTKLNNLLAQLPTLNNYYSSCLAANNYERITDTFKQNLSNSYPTRTISGIVNLYISSIAQIYNLSQDYINNLQIQLSTVVSPITGNPTGVLKFVSIYEQLIKELSRYVLSEWQENANTNSTSIFKKDTIEFKKEFIHTIDCSVDRKVVFDYFNINNGILSLSDFRKRINSEIKNYSLNNTNIYNNEYSVSYLSPTNITIQNVNYDNIFDRQQENLLFLKNQIKLLNKNKNIIANAPPEREVTFKQLRSSFIEQGVSFEFLKNTKTNIQIDDLENNNKQINSGAETQRLNNSIRLQPKIGSLPGSVNISSVSQKRIDDAMESIEKLDSGKNTLRNDFKQIIGSAYPNQLIKFENSLDRNLNNIDNLFKYAFLVQIEYYNGTDWLLLTDTELDILTKQQFNKNIFCRIRKYDYNNFGLLSQNVIKYDFTENFILFIDEREPTDFITISATTFPRPTTRPVQPTQIEITPSPQPSPSPPTTRPPTIQLPAIIQRPTIGTNILDNIPNLVPSIGKKPFFDNRELINDLMGGINIPNIPRPTRGIASPTATPVVTTISTPVSTAISTPVSTAISTPVATVGTRATETVGTTTSLPTTSRRVSATTSENFSTSSVSSNSVPTRQSMNRTTGTNRR
jgi:hypothetical protein